MILICPIYVKEVIMTIDSAPANFTDGVDVSLKVKER